MRAMLSLREVAEACGMSVGWARRQARAGRFPGLVRWPGGDLRVPVQDVKEFLRRFLVKNFHAGMPSN